MSVVPSLAGRLADETATLDAATSPDGDDSPQCGLALPEDDPPTCPRCGAPF